ncbi:MAG: hypothetical protein ACP5HG_13125 [Anaerolineae bacterium]
MRVSRMILLILAIIAAIALVGCQSQAPDAGSSAAVEATLTATPLVGAGARTPDAQARELRDVNRLALGTLALEETEDAVTSEQASELLPLWTLIQDGALQGEAEVQAVLSQIQSVMTEAQIMAIAEMELGQPDAQARLAEGDARSLDGDSVGAGRRGLEGAGAGMSAEERSAMRERLQNMTEEERAELTNQLGARRGTADASPSVNAIRAVVALLSERSEQSSSGAGRAQPDALLSTVLELTEPTPDAYTSPTSTRTPIPTPTVESQAVIRTEVVATVAPGEKGETPVEYDTVPASQMASADIDGQSRPESTPDPVMLVSSRDAVVSPVLDWIPDADPGPPLVVEVTTNYAEPNPNLEGGHLYTVGGYIRNPTDEAYTVTAVHVTFYDADGFRGAFYPFPREGERGRPSGEWKWHGAIEADIDCVLLAPGASCPFFVRVGAQNMASFLVHPDAVVAEWHTPAAIKLTSGEVLDQSAAHLRIQGVATNSHAYPVKNVVVTALLVDASGQIVSMGSDALLEIAAGAATSFDIHLERRPYVRYELYVQAEQKVG